MTQKQTISDILENASVNDVLICGDLQWKVYEKNKVDNLTIAVPDNDETDFELWSCGVETVSTMEGLQNIGQKDNTSD